MTLSASLPLIIIFERHWDETPKQLVQELLPKLVEEGYSTLCMESPQNISTDKFLTLYQETLDFDFDLYNQAESFLAKNRVNNLGKLSDVGFEKLTHLMRLYVSSQRYLDVAEKIKNLPAALLLKDILIKAQHFGLEITGVDIDYDIYTDMISFDLSKRMKVINKNEIHRIKTMTDNLSKLYKEQKGLIFIGGALHADNLISKFKELGMQNNILYYFPHSIKRYDESLDDINEALMNKTLENHTYCLVDKKSISNFSDKIIKEIKNKNISYQEELPDGNSTSTLLSHIFNIKIKTFKRPGYYVDALIENKTNNFDEIIKNFEKINIQTYQTSVYNQNHLVIRDINTKEIADKIYLLKN